MLMHSAFFYDFSTRFFPATYSHCESYIDSQMGPGKGSNKNSASNNKMEKINISQKGGSGRVGRRRKIGKGGEKRLSFIFLQKKLGGTLVQKNGRKFPTEKINVTTFFFLYLRHPSNLQVVFFYSINICLKHVSCQKCFSNHIFLLWTKNPNSFDEWETNIDGEEKNYSKFQNSRRRFRVRGGLESSYTILGIRAERVKCLVKVHSENASSRCELPPCHFGI